MCVCKTGWDLNVYWSKVFTGFAFSMIHFVTPMIASIFIKDWRTIMISIFTNEIVEELIVATTGKWGYSLDPPFDLEARYDTLIRDIVLSAGLGTWVGNRFNAYIDTVDVFPSPLFENDKFVVTKRIIALIMMERA